MQIEILKERIMKKALHIAAQYLATAGVSFLDKEDDDSHTNLGWNNKSQSLLSRPLNDEDLQVGLNYNDFSLEFILKNKVIAKLPLKETSHAENIEWIKGVFNDLKFKKKYAFDLHYEMPYDKLDAYIFPKIDKVELEIRRNGRSDSCDLLSSIAAQFEKKSEVRTWAHHFDTGLLVELESGLQIGMGYAMPDTMVDDFYHYVSAWNGEFAVSVEHYKALANGEWRSDGWNGAILKSDNLDKKTLHLFYQSALETYQEEIVEAGN